MKHHSFAVGIIFGVGLLVASTSALAARADGTEKVFSRTDVAFTDSEAVPRYWLGNRTGLGDNTKWEWRWSKYYPEFAVYCASNLNCVANVQYSRAESLADMVGVSFAGAGTIKALTDTLTAQFQRTFTTTVQYSFTQTVNIANKMNAYAGIITLQREQKNAPVGGRWDRIYNTCVFNGSPIRPSRCTYKWTNWPTEAGTWNGTQNTNKRTYLCTTATVVSPQNGQTLPSGCSRPALPSGWYGG